MINQLNLAECPYNKNHRFAISKLYWHLGRCKDKLKNQHLYRKCRFNPMHVHLLDEIDNHQAICKDRVLHQKLILELKTTLGKCKSQTESSDMKTERSRSRDRRFVLEPWKKQEAIEINDLVFEQCEDCQKMMKLFMQKNKDKNHKILKLIKKYKSLTQS